MTPDTIRRLNELQAEIEELRARVRELEKRLPPGESETQAILDAARCSRKA